jgi:uncharacterized protein with von Willebrand factor type A (vWA) domain
MARILAFLVCLSSCFAQSNVTTGRQVYVDVRRNKGLVVVDPITPIDFQVKLNGHPVNVVAAERKAVRSRVAIVLDTSGSMSSNEKIWDLSFQIAENLVKNLDGNSILTLVVSGDKVAKIVSDRDGASSMLHSLQEYHDHKDKRFGFGRTQLWDTISTAVIAGHLGVTDALIAITDGGDNSSRLNSTDLEKELRSLGIRAYGVLFVSLQPSTPEEREGPNVVKYISEVTGGFSLPIMQGSEIRATADRITISITRPCVLDLDLQAGVTGRLSVAYRGDAGKFNRGVTVFAPKSLFPVPRKENAEAK